MADRNQFPSGIYGITAERFSRGRTNIEVAEAMIEGGVKILQYREKAHLKSTRAMREECRVIGALARRRDVLFIVNDFVDIALLSDADGVHVGQDDLPVSDVRQLLGPDKLIGLSTHSPEQARQAETAGADYIGVGPLYATKTKEDVCAPVGLAYLDFVVENIALPFVAIGGIKQHNIEEVVRHGARTVCLVTEIVASNTIRETVQDLHRSMAGVRSGDEKETIRQIPSPDTGNIPQSVVQGTNLRDSDGASIHSTEQTRRNPEANVHRDETR